MIKIHRENSQEYLINDMRGVKVEDPLSYEDVEFQNKEWDNIPYILPRWIMHMDRHLKALISHCYLKNQEETTTSLRHHVFTKIDVCSFVLLLANSNSDIS